MNELLLNRKQSAAALGICVRSLDHAVSCGLLRPRRLGRRVLFTPEALKRFAARDHARLAPAPRARDER